MSEASAAGLDREGKKLTSVRSWSVSRSSAAGGDGGGIRARWRRRVEVTARDPECRGASLPLEGFEGLLGHVQSKALIQTLAVEKKISLNLIINEAPVLPTLDAKDRRETAQLLASFAILASGRT
jgi:hypothetical protein